MAKISVSKRPNSIGMKSPKVVKPIHSKAKAIAPRASRIPKPAKKSGSTVNKITAEAANRIKRTSPPKKKIKSVQNKSLSKDYLRKKAVRQAWKQETQLVRETGKGSRNWTRNQLSQITKGKKIKGYEGHHIRDVSSHSKKWTGDPRNIKFVTRREHLKAHKGNFKNPTTGKLIDRQKMARQNRIVRQSPKK